MKRIDTQEIMQSYIDTLNEAISLLKQCVNYDGEGMTTAISGELGDRIKEFIGRCGEC